jgi:hypothetical protein
MMHTLLLPILAIAVLLLPRGATAQNACACGPDFCTNDGRIPALLQQKKARLAAVPYPARLVALLDRGQQCVARIERSPDIFSLVLVEPDDSKLSLPWSKEDEDRAKGQVASGKLKRFWIIHARRAFSCCGQRPYNEMPDYNAEDDVNTSLAIKCEKGASC